MISQQQGTEDFFYLEDGHSGVRQLVDENGMVTDSYSYDAYGNLLGSTGTSENDYLYQGEQFDDDFDLQYLRARYYDPTMGRFISTDPFEGHLEQPVSRHRYLYGNSNPITYIDPSGMIASVAELGARNAIEYNLQTRVSVTLFTVVNAVKKYFEKPITWTGFLSAGAVGDPRISLIPEFPITPVGAAAGLILTSECVARESAFGAYSTAPFGERLKDNVWALIGGGVASGELYFSAAAGPIDVYSPRQFGINPLVFTPAFVAGGFNAALGIFNLEGLVIGAGWSGSRSFGAGYLTGNSISALGGISIHMGGPSPEICFDAEKTL